MAFSTATITGAYLRADGAPATGTIAFTPSAEMQNAGGNQTVGRQRIRKRLVNGAFSVALRCTDDADTEPSGVTYAVRVELDDAPVVTYDIEVLSAWAGTTVNLADIAPAESVATFTYTLVSTLAATTDSAQGDALVGMQQPFSGAAARTVHAKLKEILSVRDFGAVGDGTTDDSAAFQAAIDAASSAAGSGRESCSVYVPGKGNRYRLDEQLELADGVFLYGDGPGATTLDFSQSALSGSAAVINGGGTITQLTASATAVQLGTTVAAGSTSVVLSADPDNETIAAGDIIAIYDSTDGSWMPALVATRPYYHAGEWFRVQAYDSGARTITSTSPLYDSYTAGSDIVFYRMTPIQTGVFGMTILLKSDVAGPRIVGGNASAFHGLELRGSDVNHLWFDRCFECFAERIHISDRSNPASSSYGIAVCNSQRVSLTQIQADTARHAVSLGGATVAPAVPTREVVVSGGYLSSRGDSAGLSMDMHGNTEHCTVDGVHCASGIAIGGDHHRVKGCTIGNAGLNTNGLTGGYAVYMATELKGMNISIQNCDIYAAIAPVSGYLVLMTQPSGVLTRGNGCLRITGNTLDLNGFTIRNDGFFGAIGVSNLVNLTAAAWDNDVDISNNTIIGSPSQADNTAGLSGHGIAVRTVAGAGFRNVRVKNNMLSQLGVFISNGFETLDVSGNTVQRAHGRGLYVAQVNPTARTPRIIQCVNNVVEQASLAGIELNGVAGTTVATVGNNTSVGNCQNASLKAGTARQDSSCYLKNLLLVNLNGNTFGDAAGTPTQSGAYGADTVTTLHDVNNIIVGALAADVVLSGARRRYLRGQGGGSPEGAIVASIGSQWLRTDGSTSTTLYVKTANDTTNTGWTAK